MTGIKLEVGKRYVRRNGALRRIVRSSGQDEWTYISEDGLSYRADGSWGLQEGVEFPLDLVAEHVEPAPEAGAVVPAGEMTGKQWIAGRDAFVLYADRYEKADKHELRCAIADVAPAEIVKAVSAASPPPPPVSAEVVGKMVEALKHAKSALANGRFVFMKSAANDSWRAGYDRDLKVGELDEIEEGLRALAPKEA